MHEDSMGTQQRITPGSVNWMVAGKGASHTERTPWDLRNGNQFLAHGYQIWVALPKESEEMLPEFHHIEADKLPRWNDGTAQFTLIAGQGYGRTSPVPVFSPLFMVEIKNSSEYVLNTMDQLRGEIGICIVEGAIEACGERVEKGNILVSKAQGHLQDRSEARYPFIVVRRGALSRRTAYLLEFCLFGQRSYRQGQICLGQQNVSHGRERRHLYSPAGPIVFPMSCPDPI